MQPIEPRLIGHAAMSVRDDLIDDRLPADAGNRRFARRINVGHDDTIGVIEGRAKFLPQRLGPRIAMRLKHRQDAFAPGRFRGRERGANFGRMMRVVVDQQKALALVLDLETPAGVLETAQRSGDLLERNSQFGGERDDTERVAARCAGPARSGSASPSCFAPPKDTKDRGEILQLNIGAAIIRVLREAEGDRARTRRHTDAAGVRIIGAIENRAAGLIEQLPEDRFDRGEVRIKIEMLFLDVQNERVLGMEKAQRAVALVAFRHEIFAARIPMRVRAEHRNFRADIMRRMQAAFAQDMRRHRRGRRLPMHARDDDSALARHDRGERFGAAHQSVVPARARSTRIGLFSLIAEEKMTSSASPASSARCCA